MAFTITKLNAGGGKSPSYSGGNRSLTTIYYDLDMDTTNYVTGGEPIATIVADFYDILEVRIFQKDTNTAGDRRDFAYDYTAQTILIYDAFNTEETASDQTVVALRVAATGYAK